MPQQLELDRQADFREETNLLRRVDDREMSKGI